MPVAPPEPLPTTTEPSPRSQVVVADPGPSGSPRSDTRHRVPVPPVQPAGASHSSHSSTNAPQLAFPVAVVNAAKARRLMHSGNSAFAKKDLEKAVNLYTEAFELDRSDGARILSNRSAALLLLKRPEAALADARLVMRSTPRSSVGYIRAGNVFHQLKRFDEAKLCYEKALALDANRNPDLQFSLRNNAVLAVYHGKTERLPICVQVNRQLEVIAVSKKNVRANDVLWTEVTSSITPADLNVDTQLFCGHCYRSLLRSKELAQQIPGVDVGIISSLMREVNPVRCHEGCSQRYCSETCRLKAWTEHHWIECEVQGKWAAAMGKIRELFKMDAASRHYAPSHVAAARLSLRMMVKVLSSGRPLSEAINNFGWLHEGAPLSPDLCVVVSNVLQPAYLLIHECLTREERALLDLSFVVSLFRRCLRNMVTTTASPWPMIVSNVETNLDLIRQRGMSHPGLESILALKPQEMVGVSIACYAVFEIFAITLLGDEPVEPNIAMRKEGETANTGVFVTLKPIGRNGTIVGSR
jgi:tetratricopeptide (TPR) repeat protein